jgi:magnesium chelatase family protein
MIAKTFSATHLGLEGTVIEIEAVLQRALPRLHITGLPSDVIRESSERVKACLGGLGFDVPSSRLVIHLSPAQARKHGSQLDLAIAFAALKAEGLLREADISQTACLGELALDGRLHAVGGAIALVEALERDPRIQTILLPRQNGWEASLIGSRKTRLAATIADAIEFVLGRRPLEAPPEFELPPAPEARQSLDAVIGQEPAKRALQIALAGHHHLLLVGPPGVGKSLIAQCAPDLLPPLGRFEWADAIKARGTGSTAAIRQRRRPFRSPHHTISGAALLGGGSGTVIPGEVTLSHTGVLFLDEFPEFRLDVIEGLREPLQSGEIHLHRIGSAVSLPARFTLIAAMNPCPCGYALGSARRCLCPPERLAKYRRKTSGPILDRIDLSVLLTTPRAGSPTAGITHATIAESIARVWQLRRERGDSLPGLGRDEEGWLAELGEREALSLRSLHKLRRVARTIADLEQRGAIAMEDLHEAWGLRCPDWYPVP